VLAAFDAEVACRQAVLKADEVHAAQMQRERQRRQRQEEGQEEERQRRLEARQRHRGVIQEELREGRAAIRAGLQPHIDAIRKAVDPDKSPAKRAYDLVKHVYGAHPPKNAKWVAVAEPKIAGLDADQYNKKELRSFIIKTASLHYHPDKNKDTSKEWCVLCEEIQREFNSLLALDSFKI
jgi:hypothetical protein